MKRDEKGGGTNVDGVFTRKIPKLERWKSKSI